MDANLGHSKSGIMQAQEREVSEERHMALDCRWKTEKVQAKWKTLREESECSRLG